MYLQLNLKDCPYNFFKVNSKKQPDLIQEEISGSKL